MTNSLLADKRRLHDRFWARLEGNLKWIKSHGESPLDFAVQVVDFSKGGMTILINGNHALPLAAEIKLDFPNETFDGGSLHGTIANCIHIGKNTRIGIKLKKELSDKILKHAASADKRVDRRQGERRLDGHDKYGKREFERRGLWQGLLTPKKRYFSHYIWGLQKEGTYFYMKPLQSATGAHTTMDGRDMIMMSSNNYLGLTTHPKVKEAAIAAIRKYGSAPSASSLLGGTLDIHIQLEEELARFKGVEEACVFSSGYVTNVTTLTTILDKGDAVINDERNHASLLDGSRLSGAHVRAYRHNSMADLEKKLNACPQKHKLVVTDSVFSMDGDVAHLPEMLRICRKHNAAFMVDEAHGTGVFGENGKGALEHFGIEGKADIVMGTLSKSLAGTGGFIGGNRELIRILKHTARAFVFSAYLPPSVCASVLTALKIIKEEPERREQLWRNATYVRNELKLAGFNAVGESPIIPVIFPEERQTLLMTRGLREAGIYVSPVVYPAVKKNATRIRLTVMATHSEQDLERAMATFKKVYKSISG